MRLRVLLFGHEALALGAPSIDIDLPHPARASDLRHALARAHPALNAPHLRLAVNHAFAAPDTPINPNDEIAVIGLVSGG